MSTATIDTSTKSRRPVPTPRASGEKTKAAQKTRSTPAVAKPPKPPETTREGRVTKCERLLSLLEGASIEDMMQATKWQQHSVRGFLAGTVKKKLGFSLTSSKLSGDVRRYRIETRRGR